MAMDMNRMMKQARKMQAEMAKAQEELMSAEYTATAGGGMVEATVGGDMRVKSLVIDPQAADPDDIEMLSDMIIAAIVEAQTQAETASSRRMESITGGVNIPGLM